MNPTYDPSGFKIEFIVFILVTLLPFAATHMTIIAIIPDLLLAHIFLLSRIIIGVISPL